MGLFGAGTADAQSARAQTGAQHPSAPIPVVGPGVGESIRISLGESGIQIFPLMLGAAEFGWNVDLESSHEILDAYVEWTQNPPPEPEPETEAEAEPEPRIEAEAVAAPEPPIEAEAEAAPGPEGSPAEVIG